MRQAIRQLQIDSVGSWLVDERINKWFWQGPIKANSGLLALDPHDLAMDARARSQHESCGGSWLRAHQAENTKTAAAHIFSQCALNAAIDFKKDVPTRLNARVFAAFDWQRQNDAAVL